ncbi:MAG TPA: type III pantothenate kinase [Actinomycetota bacterium]|nr:type III pantothenate kinase [Actinomycetota bacterium]
MLLAADVGNTQTHLGVFDNEELIHEWRASTDSRRTTDEWGLLFGQFLGLAGLGFNSGITGVAVCSVVPRATQELRDMAQKYFGFPPVVVEPGIKTGIAILTDNPREVGADRIANAVAAHHLFPDEPVIVCDFGTAITLDAISAKGEYLGGAIATGVDTSATALFAATAQLNRVELVAPPNAIGKTTKTSVQSGIIYGTADLVDGLVERVIKELGGHARVIATGGFAELISEHSHRLERVEARLTLLGLRLIFERNSEDS